MASIDFTDGSGAATLQSAWPGPGKRFGGWVPSSRPFGDAAHGLADGRLYRFAFRDDHSATFEIRGIANTDVDIALRLIAHLLGGGSCQVNTTDSASRVYTTCGLMPETEPELSLSDPVTLEYTLRLSLLNVATSASPMLCEY